MITKYKHLSNILNKIEDDILYYNTKTLNIYDNDYNICNTNCKYNNSFNNKDTDNIIYNIQDLLIKLKDIINKQQQGGI